MLVQGQFLQGAEIVLTKDAEGTQLSLRNGDGKGSAAEEYKGRVTVRVLCEDAESAAVELYADGGYGTVDSTAIGSYLEFQMESPGIFRVTAAQKDNSRVIAIIAVAAAAAVLLIIILLIAKTAKKRRLKKDGSGKEDREDM